jgi:hypothetical protein
MKVILRDMHGRVVIKKKYCQCVFSMASHYKLASGEIKKTSSSFCTPATCDTNGIIASDAQI